MEFLILYSSSHPFAESMKSTPVKLNDMPPSAMASLGNQYPHKLIKSEVKSDTNADPKTAQPVSSSVTPVMTSKALMGWWEPPRAL